MPRNQTSGVVVLSGTESGGCSGSELTEPDSPCSPASPPSPPSPASVPPWTVASGAARKSHQGTITQYYHKMKTHSLKRDYAWSKAEDAKKRCINKATVAQDIEKYISLLSHTLNPKVLLDATKVPDKTSENTCSNGFVRNVQRPKIVPVYMEQVDTSKLQDTQVNGATHGSNNFLLNNGCKKPAGKKDTPRRNKKVNCKPKQAAVRTWFRLEGGVTKPCPHSAGEGKALTSLPVDKGTVNIADTAPKITMANSGTHLRTLPITFNGAISSLQQMSPASTPNCAQMNLAPHCTVPQQANMSASLPTNLSANLSPFVAMPQVLLTALRIPQPQNGMNGVNPSNGINGINNLNNMNGFTRQNVNLTSPTKLNGQFVFPLLQNINGAMVQIPNIMTKVGHNFVIPHSAQLQPQLMTQQTDAIHQHQQQLLINGTLLKLTSSISPAYSSITTKPTTTTNISYPLPSKSLNTAQPTVLSPKPNFTTLNVGSHSVLVPQPGYFLNPVQNGLNFSSQNQVNTSCTIHTVQSPAVQNSSPCYTVSNTSSIPIPPVKPPDKDKEGEPPKEMPQLKKISSSDYPNLTKLLNSSTVPTHVVEWSRPFAAVSKSTEKMFDITLSPAELTPESPVNEDSLQELKDDISPARTPESEELFTKITVMKQVSSDVQNTVMETTFSCVTNESSESGIGTDKSIDSPMDSRTSKECDDDSLSLSVSVCSVEVQSCQKSPILKQPQILRFPPKRLEPKIEKKGRRSGSSSMEAPACRWENCREIFTSDTDLLDHLQVAHVTGQAGRENYVCLWGGCKVRGKPSCSRLWLERHALSHAGNKPFKCIVDDCERRFSTQMLLERHVNNHFNEQPTGGSNARKSTESGPKLIRRNGKVLRYRRQPWSARMFDFFDAGMMEGLAWRLVRVTCWRAHAPLLPPRTPPAHRLTLVAALAGLRYNTATDTREALVTYTPPHVLEDEWIPEAEVKRTRSIDMSQLPARTKVLLFEQFCDSYRPRLPSLPEIPPKQAKTSESSRMLNDLIAGKKTDGLNGYKNGVVRHVKREEKVEVSGAAKRKMGRRHGGNAFWPCGR